MQRRTFVLLSALVATSTLAAPALAKTPTVSIATPRISLGQLMPKLDEPLAAVDLGPAPAPNGSRVITKQHIEDALEAEDVQGVTNIPTAVRVVREMQTLKASELDELTKAAIRERGLKRGIVLVAVKPPARVKVAAGWDTTTIQLPKHPKRKGPWATTAMLSFRAAGERVARIAIRLTFEISEEATHPDIEKGTELRLTVKSRSIHVSIKAHAGTDADVGDTFPVQLRPSGRMVTAKLVSPREAVAGAAS